jgi:aminoglycoside phosphotransferase (APT) family kinase protein
MAAPRMHADEADIDSELVCRLLASQFPHWADLPLQPVVSAGTDNAMYRLGNDMAIRLPRVQSAAGQIDKEHHWLPRLAPHLPLAIPVPLAKGSPAEGYPWSWSIYRWLEGDNATNAPVSDLHQAARDLGRFVTALQQVDPQGGPQPGRHNFFRGEPLKRRDEETRQTIDSLDGVIDAAAAMAAWEAAMQVPEWHGKPVWIHGDLQSGNLLTVDGRLSAVIDFGGLAVGDPAGDLIVAWNLLNAETRQTFRAALSVDDETWARGRGWTLTIGVVALAYYQVTNPVLAEISRYSIEQVLSDYR